MYQWLGQRDIAVLRVHSTSTFTSRQINVRSLPDPYICPWVYFLLTNNLCEGNLMIVSRRMYKLKLVIYRTEQVKRLCTNYVSWRYSHVYTWLSQYKVTDKNYQV